MQYILTEEEFHSLVPKKDLKKAKDGLEAARLLILKESGFQCGQTYCDDCPISKMEDNQLSRQICYKRHGYSK
jgi:hypothetical protein